MEGTLVGKATCEILLTPQCDSSDNEQANFISGPKKSTRKRKRDSLLDAHGVLSGYKMGPIPWALGFVSARASESETDDLSESSSGAFYVVKGYESAVTAIVTDSEDDLYFLEEAVEFEPPGSDSEQEGEEEDEEDIISLHTSEDEDPGADGGDEYEEDEPSDSEIDEDDHWMCPECSTNNHPMSRQCARCWTLRLEWLPHLKRSISAPVMEVSLDTNEPSPPVLQKSASLAVSPAMENRGSLISSSLVKDTVTSNMLSTDTCLPPKRMLLEQAPSLQPAYSETGEESVLQYSGSKIPDCAHEPDLCVICLVQPRNASLVHGRTGHQVCCIGCAEKLKEGKKKCPVCRKKIRLVVKNFF